MSLDVFVMPLWKFKVGDFASPIEANLGIRPKYASSEGISELPTSASWWQRFRARREVAAIRKSVAKANRIPISWRDDGSAVLSFQWPDFAAVRAYAAWLDVRDRLPDFTAPPEDGYHKHPALELDVDQPSCPHLTQHGLHNGYFLPCDFEHITQVEPYLIFGHWPASHSVGSAPRLLRELEFVQRHLQIPPDYEFDESDPLCPVKEDYLQLRKATDHSMRSGLPIIFWG